MAELAATAQSLEAVPEPLRELYSQGDNGAYALQVEGTTPGTDSTREIREIRERNIRLDQEARAARDALEMRQKQHEGIEPETARRALEKDREVEQELADKNLLRQSEAQKLIEANMKPLIERCLRRELLLNGQKFGASVRPPRQFPPFQGDRRRGPPARSG
jgi:hypothetical protein